MTLKHSPFRVTWWIFIQLHGIIRYAIVWGATLLSEASFMEFGKSALPVSEINSKYHA